ncbi:MAG: stage II sporulation protein R [Ruminococcaceae bacterium]|nr:stage II sporulation protein R [Oscillospiraceae bacterium]
MKYFKRMEAVLCAALVLCIGLNIFSFGLCCREVRQDVLRLHILANSDSKQDQELKYKVRDAVLHEHSGIFKSANTVEQAKLKANENLEAMRKTAVRTLRQNGCDKAVTVKLEKAFFQTRYYRDFTLPAGEYEAVRIVIGDGEGHNWWCVMFPQMCLAASTAAAAKNLSDEEKQLIFSDPQFEVRFKCVEMYEKFINWL